jgi:hypothetical protein
MRTIPRSEWPAACSALAVPSKHADRSGPSQATAVSRCAVPGWLPMVVTIVDLSPM